MTSFFNLPNWTTDASEFCKTISLKKSVFKILLKTKNDPIFLERWIVHHLKIVGSGNCIIFDNMSDDSKVLAIYQKYFSDVPIIQFPGFHNNVHDSQAFSALYQALAESTSFFGFFDTDEFLVLFERDEFRVDDSLTEFIQRNGSSKVFPTTWLNNTDWSPSRFVCGTSEDLLINGFSWGKPILAATEKLTGFINHNIQVEKRIFDDSFVSNFFLLHMTNLLPEQRLRANLNKLVSRGFANSNDTIENVLQFTRDHVKDSNILQYLREIEFLSKLDKSVLTSTGALRAGCLELNDDGSIKYYGRDEQQLINAYLSSPRDIYRKSLQKFSTHVR